MKSKKLPITTRHNGKSRYVPGQSAIDNMLEFLKYSPEGILYAVESFARAIAKLVKPSQPLAESAKKMQRKLEAYSDYVQITNPANGEEWQGKMPKEGHQKYQEHIANNAANDIEQLIKKPIKIDFAVSNNSDYIRGFTEEGTKLIGEVAKRLDNIIFDGFFASIGLFHKDGIVYESEAIKKGEEHRADPEKVREQIEEGLQSYLEAKSIPIDVVKLNPHPADKVEETPTASPAT